MSKTKLLQTNFTSGEISPLMFGRVDTNRYVNGAAQVSNFIVKPEGGAWFRQGSKFVGQIKNMANKVILREFEFSDTQTYVLEIGAQYIRIYYNNGFVETVPGNGVPLEVWTPYLQADLPLLQFAQSADTLYIVHPLYMPQKFQRVSANNFTLTPISPQDGPYMSTSKLPNATLTISNLTSIATATSNTAIFAAAATTKNIAAIIELQGAVIQLTVIGHGYSTGNTVNVAGILYTNPHNGNVTVAPYPYGNGQYTITIIDANNFTLNGSTMLNASAQYNVAGGTVQLGQTIQYIEYRQNNVWILAKVLSITSSTVAQVSVIQNLYPDYSGLGLVITASGTNITCTSNSGVFTQDNIGQYIRISSGAWYQITGYTNDSTVVAAAGVIPTYIYTPAYPITLITVTIPVVTATITSSVALFATATDAGRLLRLNFAGNQPWFTITNVNSTTSIAVTVNGVIPVDPLNVNSFFNQGATNTFYMGSWSNTTGFPQTVCFHQERLCFGGSNTEPQSLWMSVTNDYENFAPSAYNSVVADNNSIAYTFVSNKANPIRWLESDIVFFVGTLGAEFVIQTLSGGPVTPTNLQVSPNSRQGSLYSCRSLSVGNALLFIQRAARKLFELTYQFQLNKYIGTNLTIVSEHIYRQGGGAVNMVLQKEPNMVIWTLLSNGTLAGFTYEQQQQVNAWHRHQIAGVGATVEAICSTHSLSAPEDTLYMIVNRTINGAVSRTIEYLSPEFYPVNNTDRTSVNMYFLDGGFTYNGAATNTVTLIYWLKNETVSVVADGNYIGEVVISNTGTLTLPNGLTASTVHFGYKYTGTLQLLPLAEGSKEGGSALGKAKRVGRTLVKVLNSLTFKYGMDLTKLDQKVITDDAGKPVTTFYTGDTVVNMSQGYRLTTSPCIVQDQPYPLIVLAVGPDTEVGS